MTIKSSPVKPNQTKPIKTNNLRQKMINIQLSTPTLLLVFYTCVVLLIQSTSSLQISKTTTIPPLLDVPTYSLATINSSTEKTTDSDDDANDANDTGTTGTTNMNVITYATPISISPNRLWSIGLYKQTKTYENFIQSKKGILQLLSINHTSIVKLLGGSSGRDVDKCLECDKLGFGWISSHTDDDTDDGEDTTDGIDRIDESWPQVLPGCTCYIRLSLVGDMIDCGSHDVAICKVESMFVVGNDGNDGNEDTTHLSTSLLREMGIITEQGRVAED